MSEVRTAVPGYWMHETSGVLRPAIESYLCQDPIFPQEHVAAMRAYLRQWIAADGWRGAGVEDLRTRVDGLVNRQRISGWLADALELGIDPL